MNAQCTERYLPLLQVNKTGLKLECSEFKPEESSVAGKHGVPVVIYCHCNSGSRRDAEEALHVVLPQGIHIVTLDFAVRPRSLNAPFLTDVLQLKPRLLHPSDT